MLVSRALESQPFGRTYVMLLSAVVLLMGGVLWALLDVESQAFRDDWAQEAPPGTGRPGTVAWVAASSELSGQNADSFAATCAFDGGRGSAWLSDRSRGPGEMVAVAYERPVVVSRAELIPGWFSTAANYEATAKPQAVEIFSDTGAVRDWALPESIFSRDPSPVVLNLLDHPEGALQGTVFFVRVLRIEGDVRAHSAITEITLTARVTRASEDQPVVHSDSVRPRLTMSRECSSTDWAYGGD